MDLYEAWQKRRWKKLRAVNGYPEILRKASETERPRITQADVLRNHDVVQARQSPQLSRQNSAAVREIQAIDVTFLKDSDEFTEEQMQVASQSLKLSRCS